MFKLVSLTFFKRTVLIIISIIFLSGCAKKIPTLEQRKQTVFNILQDKTVIQKNISTQDFNLFSLIKVSNECQSINIYIEGDGLSWISKSVVSSDPTPLNPIALSLMNADKTNCKVYIARPCQYINSNQCEEKYWTSHRFNSKIIQSYNEALDNFKNIYHNQSFTLIGYSGGGAVATLVASKRDDIQKLITVAGNLDTVYWTNMQRVSSLHGSLNPADFTQQLKTIPQYHLIGKNDTIIPKEVFFSYYNRFENKKNIAYKMVDSTHTCCWETVYQQFLKDNE